MYDSEVVEKIGFTLKQRITTINKHNKTSSK